MERRVVTKYLVFYGVYSFPKSTIAVNSCRAGAWHSRNMLTIMVSDEAFLTSLSLEGYPLSAMSM